jgi:putative transposase
MARTARKRSQSGIYHVILRGINRQVIFEDDKDRAKLLETLKYYKDISKYEIFAYCLMDNHVHLLMKQNEEAIGKSIKRISGSYVFWFNGKYKRIGHLFQERFMSETVEDDQYFLTVLRYIHQKPISAGLTNQLGGYQWSSYHEYLGSKYLLSDTEFALKLLSDDRKKALEEFEKFMNEFSDNKCLDHNEKNQLFDLEVRKYLLEKGITSISELQKMSKSPRDEIIRAIKLMDGASVRQIARIIGISKSVVDRA